MNKINIRQFFDHETCTFTYLLWDLETLDAIIIDSVLEQTQRDSDFISKFSLKLKYILETHIQADHITGAAILKDRTDAKICYGSKTGVKGADVLLEDNETITFGEFQIKAIYTPGHTNGCTCYYIDGYMFTGDTLFIEGTGRTDFQGGSANKTYDSVRSKIFSFPDYTIIYPAHNYKGFNISTIAHERKFNPNVGDHVSKEV